LMTNSIFNKLNINRLVISDRNIYTQTSLREVIAVYQILRKNLFVLK